MKNEIMAKKTKERKKAWNKAIQLKILVKSLQMRKYLISNWN